MENIICSLKDELISESEDLTFSDEETETSPKKIAPENNSISTIKTTPGKLIIILLL